MLLAVWLMAVLQTSFPDHVIAFVRNCGEQRCQCRGKEADCRYADLDYIPKLPVSVAFINLGSNRITGIPGKAFFANITHIAALEMTANGLTSVAPGAFDDLLNLYKLDLSFNDLKVLPNTTFSCQTRHRLLHLDVSHNPFHCDCRLAWLARWMDLSAWVFQLPAYQVYYNCWSRSALGRTQHRIAGINFTECGESSSPGEGVGRCEHDARKRGDHQDVWPSVLTACVLLVLLLLLVTMPVVLCSKRLRCCCCVFSVNDETRFRLK